MKTLIKPATVLPANRRNASQTKNFFRLKKGGAAKTIFSPVWGTYTIPIDDPEGIDDEKVDFEEFKLVRNFPKIKNTIWAPWTSLAFHMCSEGKLTNDTMEVSVNFVRNEEDPRKWMALVPRQIVGATTVRMNFSHLVNLVTGEEYEGWPDGWIPAGSSHSHNRMGAFFSPMDDQYELGEPGTHTVIGNLDERDMSYSLVTSIVQRKTRFIVESKKMIDLKPSLAPFHKRCLEYITIKDDLDYSKEGSRPTESTRRGFHSFKKDKSDDEDFMKSSALFGLAANRQKRLIEVYETLKKLGAAKNKGIREALHDMMWEFSI